MKQAVSYELEPMGYWLRCCPRCSGDVLSTSDNYGQYHACAQCGYYLSDAEAARLRPQASPMEAAVQWTQSALAS